MWPRVISSLKTKDGRYLFTHIHKDKLLCHGQILINDKGMYFRLVVSWCNFEIVDKLNCIVLTAECFNIFQLKCTRPRVEGLNPLNPHPKSASDLHRTNLLS